MVTQPMPAFGLSPQQKQIILRPVIAAGLVFIVFLFVVTTSAHSLSPEQLRLMQLQGWVNALRQDRLTAQRQIAQNQLERAGESAVLPLMVALRSDNPVLRRNAAEMLGYLALPGALQGLQEALAKDAVPQVRRKAAWALGEIMSFAAIADLQRAALSDQDLLVRQTAQDSLARIRTRTALAASVNERELTALAVAPSSTQIVYVAARRDLKISRDGGATWDTLHHALPGLTNVLTVSPTNPLTLYAGGDRVGMYKSVDGGHTWSALNSSLNVAHQYD